MSNTETEFEKFYGEELQPLTQPAIDAIHNDNQKLMFMEFFKLVAELSWSKGRTSGLDWGYVRFAEHMISSLLLTGEQHDQEKSGD
jgi:hypothetical protein